MSAEIATEVSGFADRCVTTPPRGRLGSADAGYARGASVRPAAIQERPLGSNGSLWQRAPHSPQYLAPIATLPLQSLGSGVLALVPAFPKDSLMLDFAAARRMMVDCQVRTSDVTDLRLIAAMLAVPRERFVPETKADLAYLDLDLPVIEERGKERRLL